MNYFWKGTDGPEESETEESAESPEEKAEEFAEQFTLRGIERIPGARTVIVTVVYHNGKSRPDLRAREYDYYIDEDKYVYDKVEIGKEIQRQHKERAARAKQSRERQPRRFGSQNV
jgi:hypothetical protein